MCQKYIKMKYWHYILLLGISIVVWTCSTGNNNADKIKPPTPSNISGQELAAIYCANCHLKPEPELLDKKTWEKGVLPEMAFYLGKRLLTDKFFDMNPDDISAAIQSGLYPSAPVLAEEDWDKIVAYYISNAPEKPLPQKEKQAVKVGLPFFEVKMQAPVTASGMRQEGVLPLISMVKIDTFHHQLYVSRRDKSLLEIYDKTFKKQDSIVIESPVSDMILSKGGDKYILQMGIMDPNDLHKGKLSKLNPQNQLTTVIDSLQRPVHLDIFDINEDGIEDFLICNFGNLMGKLAWYDGKTHKETVLSPLPGARRTIIRDMNNDGKPDIVALFCQARERVSIFYNKGAGNFEEDIVLEFPSIYGSSYIDLADMNGDGKLDILYTNGDNADYSIVLKNYHGIRIFSNDGQNKFKEQYFYPIYGATQVIARDFDGDGDVDMATIAFFLDSQDKPTEGFLFFENKGNSTFNITTFVNSSHGRWLVMDVADMDGDGRDDIVLGSFFRFGTIPTKPLSFVWLKNIAIKRVK